MGGRNQPSFFILYCFFSLHLYSPPPRPPCFTQLNNPDRDKRMHGAFLIFRISSHRPSNRRRLISSDGRSISILCLIEPSSLMVHIQKTRSSRLPRARQCWMEKFCLISGGISFSGRQSERAHSFGHATRYGNARSMARCGGGILNY